VFEVLRVEGVAGVFQHSSGYAPGDTVTVPSSNT